ncbi:hypothetical protein FIBSPDRAFT_868119, partial [Athelia psychrophila]
MSTVSHPHSENCPSPRALAVPLAGNHRPLSSSRSPCSVLIRRNFRAGGTPGARPGLGRRGDNIDYEYE